MDAHHFPLVDDSSIVVSELLGEAARKMDKLAVARDEQVSVVTAWGIARGDWLQLRQVLLIFLDNAERFAPSGGTIRLASQARSREVVITVADRRPGIPPDHLPHIFERFFQVPGQAGEGRGNGLGLSIAKGLVEAHHGKISIESQPGKGTSVQVLLPAG